MLLVHMVFVSERNDVPGCVFKSSVCAAAAAVYTEKVASKGLLSLMSTWMHRGFGQVCSLSWARGCYRTGLGRPLPQLGVNRGWGMGHVRAPCCCLTHSSQFSLEFMCYSALSLNFIKNLLGVLVCMGVCSESMFLEMA